MNEGIARNWGRRRIFLHEDLEMLSRCIFAEHLNECVFVILPGVFVGCSETRAEFFSEGGREPICALRDLKTVCQVIELVRFFVFCSSKNRFKLRLEPVGRFGNRGVYLRSGRYFFSCEAPRLERRKRNQRRHQTEQNYSVVGTSRFEHRTVYITALNESSKRDLEIQTICRDSLRVSLVAEDLHGFDARGADGGEQGSDGRDNQDQEDDRAESGEVGGRDAVKEASEDAGRGGGQGSEEHTST